MSIGRKIIDMIIESKLLNAECPDSPESSVVFIWSANASEQLAKLVHEHFGLYDVWTGESPLPGVDGDLEP